MSAALEAVAADEYPWANFSFYPCPVSFGASGFQQKYFLPATTEKIGLEEYKEDRKRIRWERNERVKSEGEGKNKKRERRRKDVSESSMHEKEGLVYLVNVATVGRPSCIVDPSL